MLFYIGHGTISGLTQLSPHGTGTTDHWFLILEILELHSFLFIYVYMECSTQCSLSQVLSVLFSYFWPILQGQRESFSSMILAAQTKFVH